MNTTLDANDSRTIDGITPVTTKATYLTDPYIVRVYRTGGRHSLRVVVRRHVASGRLTAKVCKGDGRLSTFITHVIEQPVTESDIDTLVKNWISNPTRDAK